MRVPIVLLFGIVYLLIVFADSADDPNFVNRKEAEDDSGEEFIPTHEWQIVREGQALPKGLHVRINLETGKKEAKLISDTSKSKQTEVLLVVDDAPQKDDDTPEQHAKDIHESLLRLEKTEKNETEDVANAIREKFRSYKELKEAFNKLNMTVKTDLEIVNELVQKFKNLQQTKVTKRNDEKSLILTDLEYLVHQFDNALEFIKLEGVSDIVLPMLNSTEPKLRAEAARLLGSAAQSNVKVQIAGLENGAISSLLKTVWLDSDSTVQTRSIYAISCLIRNFPAAQAQFVKDGGLSVLAQVLEKGKENHKLQIKVITLLNDLLSERQDTRMLLSDTLSNKTELQMKLDQYKAVGLEKTLVEHGWCSRTAEVLLAQDQNWNRAKRREDLSSALTDLPVRPEHDFVEKIAHALLAMADVCEYEFKSNSDLKKMITGLKQWYSELSMKENLNKHAKYGYTLEADEDLYYSGIASILDKLNERLENSVGKDEL